MVLTTKFHDFELREPRLVSLLNAVRWNTEGKFAQGLFWHDIDFACAHWCKNDVMRRWV